ncbi:unnamed protein product [Jaminaea pallidilutea]
MSFLLSWPPFKAFVPAADDSEEQQQQQQQISTTPQDRDDQSGNSEAGPSSPRSNRMSSPLVSASSSSDRMDLSRGSSSPPRNRAGRRALVRETPITAPIAWTASDIDADQSMISLKSLQGVWSSRPPHPERRRSHQNGAEDEGLELVDAEAHEGSTRIDFLTMLPYEIALHVLLNLPSHHSLLVMGLVSRRHRILANDTIVWRHFFRRNIGWALRGDPDWVEELLADVEGGEELLARQWAQDAYSMDTMQEGLADDADASIASVMTYRRQGWKRMDRLDWRKLYALRYRLASRLGEVRSSDGYLEEDDHHNLNESFSDDSEYDDGSQGEETSDDEAAYRHLVEEESALALAHRRRHHTPGRRRRRTSHADAKPPTFAPDYRVLGSHEDNVYCIKMFLPPKHFAPSLGYVVTGSRDATIRVWSLESGRCTHVLRGGHKRSILSLDICSRATILVSASSDERLGVWSWFGSQEAIDAAKEGKSWKPTLIDRWDCHTTVMKVRLTDDYMVLGMRHGQIRCYRRHASSAQQHGHEFSADTEARTSDKGRPSSPSTSSATPSLFSRLSVYHTNYHSVNDLKVCGRLVAAAYANGEVDIIDIETGKLLHRLPRQRGVACVEYDSNFDLVVTGSTDCSIYCFRASTGQILLTLKGHQAMPRRLWLDCDKALLFSVGYDGIVNMWDIGVLLPEERVRQSALGRRWKATARAHRRHFDRQVLKAAEMAGDENSNELSSAAAAAAGEAAHDAAAGPQTQAEVTSSAAENAGSSVTVSAFRALAKRSPVITRPRYTSRDWVMGRSADRADGLAPRERRRNVRLFDVAFDGKRILTVGEMNCIVIREFLPKEERDWVGWELFA